MRRCINVTWALRGFEQGFSDDTDQTVDGLAEWFYNSPSPLYISSEILYHADHFPTFPKWGWFLKSHMFETLPQTSSSAVLLGGSMNAEFSRSSLKPADFPFRVEGRVDVVKGCNEEINEFSVRKRWYSITLSAVSCQCNRQWEV